MIKLWIDMNKTRLLRLSFTKRSSLQGGYRQDVFMNEGRYHPLVYEPTGQTFVTACMWQRSFFW